MHEEWVVVDGYPNYAVSSLGRVANLQRDRLLTLRPNDDGWLRVSLSFEGRVRDFYVHRLVASAFFDGYDPREQVIHWDGDRENNTVGNLRLRKRERYDSPRIIKPRAGRRVQIKETGQVFRTARDCANYIDGDYGSVYACLRGDRRSHMGYTFEYYDW